MDLKPALEIPQLEARLQRVYAERPGGTCRDLLRAFLPAELVEVFARRLGLDPDGPAAPLARLDGPKRSRLLGLLKELRFTVTGHAGWEEAIVTAGGVSLKDLDPRTMASKRVANLYFAGETVDLDANTGGYNLQIACSTGWLAGESAARKAAQPPA